MGGWDWRKSQGGWTTDADTGPRGRAFHAYDAEDHAACRPSFGLMASCEEPNEGSHFCPECMEIVRTHPDPATLDREAQSERLAAEYAAWRVARLAEIASR